jgi:hypothetical protein
MEAIDEVIITNGESTFQALNWGAGSLWTGAIFCDNKTFIFDHPKSEEKANCPGEREWS